MTKNKILNFFFLNAKLLTLIGSLFEGYAAHCDPLVLQHGALGYADGSSSHSLPVCLGVPQAEVDTVQALVCIGTIAAFITTLGMAHTLKTQALLFIQRDAFSIQSSPRGPFVRLPHAQVWATSFKSGALYRLLHLRPTYRMWPPAGA